MTYAVSDLHGCYQSWLALLEEIQFCDNDLLYVVGDVVDRGPDSMKLLLDLSQRLNVIPIAGNHDVAAYHCLQFLSEEVTDKTIDQLENGQEFSNLLHWLSDGGQPTMDDFKTLTQDDRAIVLDYLQEFSLYEEAEINGKSYVMVHAGIENFVQNCPLSQYPADAFLFSRADYDSVYFSDRYLITGHTPTRLISGAVPDFVYEHQNHIAIDCGCIYGGQLAAYRLEDGHKFYVPNMDT